MIEVVGSPGRIDRYNNRLRDRLREQMVPIEEPKRLGWKGGGTETTVWYHPVCKLWTAFENRERRYLNFFGFGDPREQAGLSPVVEINPPKEGLDRRMAGAFGVDEEGTSYLLHRGKVGGARKGIGKSSFLSAQSDYLREVIDGDRRTPVIVVSPLGSEDLTNHIASFASQVRAYKEAEVRGATGSEGDRLGEGDFTPEFEGTKEISLRESVEAQCKHGTVVRNLREALVEAGVSPENDNLRDLFLRDNQGGVAAVYEVKTASDRQSIYSAIGQLVMYSSAQRETNQVLVLPDDLDPGLRTAIENRGFAVVLYEWEDGEATFRQPDRLLSISGLK